MVSYATKDPIIVDNSNFSSTPATRLRDSLLENAPMLHHGVTTVDDVLEELGLTIQCPRADVDVVVAQSTAAIVA
ncbi:MAG: hypothetical protein ACLR20_04005 [Bifidobacterium longum]